MYLEFENLNQAFIGLCKEIKINGIEQMRRGHRCYEIPEPVVVAITNPCDRYVTVPERKWNKTLGWVESLWLALGVNDITMPAAYVKNLLNFSDDGKYMRAGYGPRIRDYGNFNRGMMYNNGETVYNQYAISSFCASLSGYGCDQLRFIIEKFKEDITTREACITIHNPIADDFKLIDINRLSDKKPAILPTKDTPCTRSLHFMIVNGKLNCYVDIRSNDLIWGFSAVNVFNFTFMQEYIANILNVPVGIYYHKADNLHVYEDFISLVKDVADKYELSDFPANKFYYPKAFESLEDFDLALERIKAAEKFFRNDCGKGDYIFSNNISALEKDWIRIFAKKWEKVHNFNRKIAQEKFENPILNKLFV